jgi:hypothetical protein
MINKQKVDELVEKLKILNKIDLELSWTGPIEESNLASDEMWKFEYLIEDEIEKPAMKKLKSVMKKVLMEYSFPEVRNALIEFINIDAEIEIDEPTSLVMKRLFKACLNSRNEIGYANNSNSKLSASRWYEVRKRDNELK